MYEDGPTELRIADLRLGEACPVAIGRRRTKGPTAALDRWVAVRDAVVEWAGQPGTVDIERIESDLLGHLDPVQREVAARLFARCRDAIGDADVDADPVAARVISDDGRFALRVPYTFALTHPEGDTELLRLKLTRPSDADEAAVLALGTDPGAIPGDLLADPGQVEPIDVDPAEAERRVAALFALADAAPVGDRPRPGFHCWRCDRSAVCGAYPDPWGHRIPSSARTIKVSRSTLARLAECDRRVAWKALHQLPTPEEGLFDDPSTALVVGQALHRVLETALLDDDPEGVVATHAAGLPASEQADLWLLWERHTALSTGEPAGVDVTRTELPFGVTLPVPDADTAVVAIGTIDAAGREADGTAAVVEHRTGGLAEIPHLEQELYAVATWLATGDERVAVHHHHLRADPAGACTRRVFEGDDLRAALDDLLAAAQAIAGWDPFDSLQPRHTIGDWCRTCPFEVTCRSWRDEAPDSGG